ncbi:DUF6058 family natural product biosynthesis protein [Cognatilysobacter terrigena]|uniref:DUF6058 family natural product biosynthesis protein n=1 Tax=Cognatilysobacter terrigena TaxID=2488749 RepID=UPI00105D7014|nr:DUF6058 family natural product biosynthesis protein [Lysobacter terrigena]
MSVARYLAAQYWTSERLASECGVAERTLDALVDAGIVPAPSYRVHAQGVLTSVVFGEFAGMDAAPGAYFHPGTKRWVRRALQVIARVGLDDAPAALRRGFERRFAAALRRTDRELLRIEDCFAPDGTPRDAAIHARCSTAWTYLMNGTFGLCVRDCGSVASIVRKELLQEHLTRYAARETIEDRDVAPLLTLLDIYADAAMPFAPPEYPASSRKRLVEDFGARVRSRASRIAPASPRRLDREAVRITERTP